MGRILMGRKNSRLKPQKTYTLVVCEGESERNYINNVIKPYLRKNGNHVKLRCMKFRNIDSVIGFLTKPEQPCDAVFLVCDLDECTTDACKIPFYCDQEKDLFNHNRLKRLQKGSFYSYPSIEYWYLLHCEKDYSPKNGASKEVERKFKKYLPTYTKPMPRDSKEAVFFSDRIDDAIQHETGLRASNPEQLAFATRLRPGEPETITNPMSEMALLIDALLLVKPSV